MDRQYICIDLKSFYASVECIERDLDSMDTHLVVADESRTEKTICLAVTPALKAYGVPGRARLFEVVSAVKQINAERKRAYGKELEGESHSARELAENPALALSFITAKPRMARYIDISTQIYEIYMHYISPEDMHVYSIDEVFMDVTAYLNTYGMSAAQLARMLIGKVQDQLGITATGGVGSNMYLAKVAMDVMAKHMEADETGVRIAVLDEGLYRRLFWDHRPITDFWRVGGGIAKKLAANGMYTMGDIARCSVGEPGQFQNEELLYRLFGKNAELLIDHAWGVESCTMDRIKAYVPENNSLRSGQVLSEPYDWDKARLIVREMTELQVLDLVGKRLTCDQMGLFIDYDRISLEGETGKAYRGEIKSDHYGRMVPAPAHGTVNLGEQTSSTVKIVEAVMDLYDRITDPSLFVRRITIAANHVIGDQQAEKKEEVKYRQMDLFTDYKALEEEENRKKEQKQKEKRVQQAVLDIQKRYGKNAMLKGMNLQEGATAMERNRQIGGHKA